MRVKHSPFILRVLFYVTRRNIISIVPFGLMSFILLSELENAPVLDTVIPNSPQSLMLQWTAPATDQHTGAIVYYEICYERSSTPHDTNCLVVSVNGNLTQTVVNDLHPFQEYKVKVRGVVAMGHGPFSSVVMATTPEKGKLAGWIEK